MTFVQVLCGIFTGHHRRYVGPTVRECDYCGHRRYENPGWRFP